MNPAMTLDPTCVPPVMPSETREPPATATVAALEQVEFAFATQLRPVSLPFTRTVTWRGPELLTSTTLRLCAVQEVGITIK